MKVLVIAWCLPPCRGSGVYRALATVRQLAEIDVEVVALTAARETFRSLYGADTDLETQIPQQVEVVRVPFYPERMWPVINDWPSSRVNSRPSWQRAIRERDHRLFPEDVYASWLQPATAEAFNIVGRGDIDLVVASGNPYVDFEVAYQVHETFEIPFVLDDRDSFLYDVFTGLPGRLFEERVDRYQDYLGACREYWCVNPPIAALHRSAHPDGQAKVRVVENGWDSDFPPVDERTGRGSGRRVGFVGTVTSGFPVDRVLEAWRAARGSEPHAGSELHFFGDIGFSRGAATGVRAALEAASAEGVVLHERVSKTKIAEAYGDLDALLFVKEGSAMITSGKAYEYAATGLPVAAIGLDGLDAARVLKGYPRLHSSRQPDQDAEAILAALHDAGAQGSDERLTAAQAFGERFERRVQLRPALDRVLDGVE